MAEHLNQTVEPELCGFSAMGKPLNENARSEAYKHCKAMGLNSARAWECVQAVAEQLERDRPYEAQAAGMKFLDLTGTYRLFAVLLTAKQTGKA
jgi:hypothetical protein